MLNSLLGRAEKVDQSIPGFHWKWLKGKPVIECKMVTPWPLRMTTRFKPSIFYGLIAGVMITAGQDVFGVFTMIIFTYLVALFWPSWPFGRTIRITPKFFKIDDRRYDINEVTQFETQGTAINKFYVTFKYGLKTIKIRVRHNQLNAFHISECLHHLVKEIKTVKAEAAHQDEIATNFKSAEEARAAAF